MCARIFLLSLAATVLALASPSASAQSGPPETFTLQLYLTDDRGEAISGEEKLICVALYEAGGSATGWTERHRVTPVEGVVNLQLGSIKPFSVQFDRAFEIEVTVANADESGEETLEPRLPLTSVPYALGPSGGTGMSLPFHAISEAGESTFTVENESITGRGIKGIGGIGVHGESNSDYSGVYGVNRSASQYGRGVAGFRMGGSGVGVYGSASRDGAPNVLFTSDVIGVAGLASGADGIGGVFRSQQGVGVSIDAATEGLRVESATTGIRVHEPSQIGLQIMGAGTAGLEVFQAQRGIIVQSPESYGLGVFGAGGDGVRVLLQDGDGIEIGQTGGHGINISGFISGNAIHVARTDGIGLRIETAASNAAYIENNSSGRSTLALKNQNPDGNLITAYNADHQRRLTVDNDGNTTIGGNLSVTGTKNFRIDHPLDPENKYLNHFAVESSEVLLTYSGNVVLDAAGMATVELPDWFDAISGDDIRYHLTPIGAPAPALHIAEQMDGGRFSIAGGTDGLKVSWQVTAIRDDPDIHRLSVPVEEPKR